MYPFPHAAVVVLVLATTAAGASPAPVAPGRGPQVDRELRAGDTVLRFDDDTRRTGLYYPPTPTYGAVALDADRDGNLEIILNRHKRRSRLYTWRGRRFRALFRTTLQAIPAGRSYYDRHSCAWGEADGDGRLDLYCASGAKGGVGEGPNQLLLARGGGWREEAVERGVADERGRGRSVNWIDYDGDGDLDLFVTNEIRAGNPNSLFRNEGGVFERDDDAGVDAVMSSSTSAWSDWDADGDPDLLVASRGAIGTIAFRNDGGRFTETTLGGITGLPWSSAAFADFDGDGLTDLHLASPDRSRILRNTGGLFVAADDRQLLDGRAGAWFDADNDGDLDLAVVQGGPGVSEDPYVDAFDFILVNTDGEFRRARPALQPAAGGSGDALVTTDYDRDGRVDLYVTNGFGDERGQPALFRNTSRAGESIALRLFGEDANPLGFGARVAVIAAGIERRAEITDGVITRGQVDVERLVFGIGVASRARVVVRWPDDMVDCAAVDAGGEIRIEKGSGGCDEIIPWAEGRAAARARAFP